MVNAARLSLHTLHNIALEVDCPLTLHNGDGPLFSDDELQLTDPHLKWACAGPTWTANGDEAYDVPGVAPM